MVKPGPSSVLLIVATFGVLPSLWWLVLKVYGSRGAVPLDAAIVDWLRPLHSPGMVSLSRWVGHYA